MSIVTLSNPNTLHFLIDPSNVDKVKTLLEIKGREEKCFTIYVSNKFARITIHEISVRQAADLASTLERKGIQIDVL